MSRAFDELYVRVCGWIYMCVCVFSGVNRGLTQTASTFCLVCPPLPTCDLMDINLKYIHMYTFSGVYMFSIQMKSLQWRNVPFFWCHLKLSNRRAKPDVFIIHSEFLVSMKTPLGAACIACYWFIH